jgi:hypothetical protein
LFSSDASRGRKCQQTRCDQLHYFVPRPLLRARSLVMMLDDAARA